MFLLFLLFIFCFRAARSVKRGDYIFTTKYCPRGLCAELVVELSLSVKQGKYEIFPHTRYNISLLNKLNMKYISENKKVI